MKRVVSHEIFGYRIVSRVKSPVFSIILFALLIVFMFADTIISNVSLQSAAFTEKENSEVLQTPKFTRKIKSDVSPVPLNIYTERKIISVESVDSDSSLGVREEQKIGRFRRKLPEYEIFRSDDLAKKFHGRVLEFLNQKCEVQFFMTWISTAGSFGRREILAVESVFNAHPHGCLMILSRTMDSVHGYGILKPLLDRKSVV